MKKYILLIIGGKKYSIEIDEELDKELRRALKENYKFDTNNYLILNNSTLVDTYKSRQRIYSSLLKQIKKYDLPRELRDKIDYLSNYINTSKEEVYNSDLEKLESMLSDALNIYDSVKNNLPKKEVEDGILNEETIEDLKEETLNDNVINEEIEEILENIIVCETVEEYKEKTGKDDTSFDIEEYTQEVVENRESKIILPPNVSPKEVAVKLISRGYSKDFIEKREEQTSISKLFNDLGSSLKISGLTYRNLNYFGDIFIREYANYCARNGINAEDMFHDYFNGYSLSTRHNTALDKFLTSFAARMGGGSRELLESMLVKKAISYNLISNKYNSFLKEPYRNLEVSGNGTINFDRLQNININNNINSNMNVSTEAKIASDVTTNVDANLASSRIGEINFGANVKANIESKDNDEQEHLNNEVKPLVQNSEATSDVPVINAINNNPISKNVTYQNKFKQNISRNVVGAKIATTSDSVEASIHKKNSVVKAEIEEDASVDDYTSDTIDSNETDNINMNDNSDDSDKNPQESGKEEASNTLTNVANMAGNVATDMAKKALKDTAKTGIKAWIMAHKVPLLIGGGVILLIFLILVIIMAGASDELNNNLTFNSMCATGDGGTLITFLNGWEGTSGASCTVNGLSGNKAQDQNDGTITVGHGVTNHLLASLTSYINDNNYGGYFNKNSNGNYYMNEGDCIPTGISDEFAEVGIQSIYGAAIDNAASANGVELTQYQKDALTSFNYNLGTGHSNELVLAYKDGGYEGLWDFMKIYVKSQGNELEGLKKRRKGEFALFVTGDYSDGGLFYGRSLDNYEDYDSEGVMNRENVCAGVSESGLIASNSGYLKRVNRPTRDNSIYYNQADNYNAYTDYEGECSWYAGHRAKEILLAANNSKTWSSMPNGGSYCSAKEVTSGMFKSSSVISSARPGALISWTKNNDYGHVAVIEEVYSDGSILISEAFISLGSYGKSARNVIRAHNDKKYIRKQNCEGNGSGCFTTRVIQANQIKNAGWSGGYNFNCYIYIE